MPSALLGSASTGANDVMPWWRASSHPEHPARGIGQSRHPQGLRLSQRRTRHVNIMVLELYRAVWEETQRRMEHVRATDSEAVPVRPWTSVLREQWRQPAQHDSLPLRWRRNPPDTFTTHTSSDGLPTIAFVIAQRLVRRHWLPVFDQVQLLDVSSAGLLSGVLTWYWRMGGVIVGTFNKVPDDLYRNGVQRERFEPFVEALRARCPVVTLSAEHDWRHVRGAKLGGRTWFTWGQETLQSLARGIVEPRPSDVMDAPGSKTLDVFGRQLPIPWSLDDVCTIM